MVARSATVSSYAVARPTAPATFSVPARRCRSCSPPCCWARMCVPCRTYSAPMPLGPSNLWPLTDTRSAPSSGSFRSTYGAACTASTWSRTPFRASHPPRDLGDRLDRAHLVVGEHDRDEDGPVGELRLEGVRVDPAVAVDRQLDDLEPELLEVAQRVADRVVLDRRRHDPMAVRLARPRRALQGEVVRLGAARREHELARLDAEARRQPVVGVVEPGPCHPPEGVRRRRVPEGVREERQHRVEDLAADRGRRRVVQVDRHRCRIVRPGRPDPTWR